jgi:16S rRNA processing protein RimM
MNRKYLEAGKIVSVHGIRGAVKVLPWADGPEFLTRFDTFYLPGEKPLTVEKSSVQNTCVLLKFAGCDSVEDAQTLRGQIISIRRDDPNIPEGTIFQADLVGIRVVSEGKEIGRLKEILTMPSSDVWVVKGERSYMIPCVPAFIPHVDPALGEVEVHLIEGMETDAD